MIWRHKAQHLLLCKVQNTPLCVQVYGIQSCFPCCLNWKSISSCLLVLTIKSLYPSFPLCKTLCCLPFPISDAERDCAGDWKIFLLFASSFLFHCFKRIKPVTSICLIAINWLTMICTLLALQWYPVIYFKGIYLTLKAFFVCLSWRAKSFLGASIMTTWHCFHVPGAGERHQALTWSGKGKAGLTSPVCA